MTSDSKKAIWAAAGVLLCVGSLGTGTIIRDRIELSPSNDVVELTNLVASTKDENSVPESKFFEDMLELLKRKYVEPIKDDHKLADGSVRGMIASLGDGHSLFMDPDQYRVYAAARDGKYEGIGALLVLDSEAPAGKVATGDPDEALEGEARMPKLLVASVVPGSSADKAGLKPGDWAEFIDGYWLPNSDALEDYKKLQEIVLDGKPTAAQEEEFAKLKHSLQEQMEKSMLPLKGRDVLMMGKEGSVKVRWKRGAESFERDMARGTWQMPTVTASESGLRLTFVADAADKLREALAGKSDLTIDLTGTAGGDYDAMLKCLAVVARDGNYGWIATRKKEKPTPLTVRGGNASPPRLTLIVDRHTRGPAEIFAHALTKFGGAKIVGGKTAGRPFVTRWFSLPSGAGYTLVTGEYRESEKGLVALAPPKGKEVSR